MLKNNWAIIRSILSCIVCIEAEGRNGDRLKLSNKYSNIDIDLEKVYTFNAHQGISIEHFKLYNLYKRET